MKVILTGTTGMVGKGVLYVCLEDPEITEVLSISRTSCGIQHEKLVEILHEDFFDLSPISEKISGYDACFFCLGVSAASMKEETYRRLTYDLTMHFAQTIKPSNPRLQFCYVSGAGTNSSEKGGMMWARVKGKTENDLMNLGFQHAWMFRPGFIQPMRGIRSKVSWYQFFYNILKPFYGLLQKLPKYVTDTDAVGHAMIRVCRNGHANPILESLDINRIGRVQ